MTKAWIKYDPTTCAIKRISWKEISGETVEINLSLAEDFMHGKEKFEDWQIETVGESLCLTKKAQPPLLHAPIQLSNFRDLSTNPPQSPIYIDIDAIKITQGGLTCNATLYMTMKNDPSWLINTWDLTKLIEDGQLMIMIKSATSYSYYLG